MLLAPALMGTGYDILRASRPHAYFDALSAGFGSIDDRKYFPFPKKERVCVFDTVTQFLSNSTNERSETD